MRVQTSDLPILLSVTTRIQTLDLKTSPSALPARQKKKFGWTTREDSNLIQNRYTMLLQQSRKINFRVNSCEDANLTIAISVSNVLSAELRTKICANLFKELKSC